MYKLKLFFYCRSLLFFLLFSLLQASAYGAEARFSWTPNSEPSLAGYKIYFGSAPGEYSQNINVGKPAAIENKITHTVSGLAEGETYYFAATAYDNDGLESSFSSEVALTIPLPLPPVASTMSFATYEDTVLTGILNGASRSGSPVRFEIVGNTLLGHVVLLDPLTGHFSYSPRDNAFGLDSFSYQLVDDAGVSNIATVSISISALNDAPFAFDDAVTTQEDNPINNVFLAEDIENDSLKYSLVNNGIIGSVTLLDANSGAYIYTPHKNAFGSDSFSFMVNDGKANSRIATVSVEVESINDAPVVFDDAIIVQEDNSLNKILFAEDVENDPLIFSIASHGTIGSVTLLDTNSGAYIYTPYKNAFGSDSFSFMVNDGKSDSRIATVSVEVEPVNDAPVAENGVLAILQDQMGSALFVASDIDSSNVTYSIVGMPQLGSVSLIDAISGSYQYIPNKGAFGQDEFHFQAIDENGVESNIAVVSVTVEQVIHQFTMEAGSVQVGAEWLQVNFDQSFANPVVVAKPASSNDPNPCVIRIRNISPAGFEIRLQNWDYLVDDHEEETLNYVALEAGRFELTDGTLVEAGYFKADNAGFFKINAFSDVFNVAPAIATSVVTYNGRDAVTSRMSSVNDSTFQYMLQEQEANIQEHVEETISYIAWEPSAGLIENIAYEVNASAEIISDAWSTIIFKEGFEDAPIFIADMQETDGMNTANLRYRDLGSATVQLQVDEEQSKDSETGHLGEIVGFMAFSIITPDEDTDLDGLTTEQERDIYGTNPSLTDTDSDGIDDGQEIEYWSLDWDADFDNDGMINLLDADSDDDGFFDGLELAEQTDPGDSSSYPGAIAIEFGVVQAGTKWQHINFKKTFVNPVVVAKIISKNDGEPCIVRLQNVDSSGFDLRLQEWDYQDGIHGDEIVSYLAVESGSYVLEDGNRIEAGSFHTDMVNVPRSVNYASSFASTPVIMSSVTTYYGEQGVTGRLSNIDLQGFDHTMQEQEANIPEHVTEQISYIAWEPSSGYLDNLKYEVRNTPDSVRHDYFPVNFTENFIQVPTVLADMQTTDGTDTASVRSNNITVNGFNTFVEEEQSLNIEISHTTEVVGYIVLSED